MLLLSDSHSTTPPLHAQSVRFFPFTTCCTTESLFPFYCKISSSRTVTSPNSHLRAFVKHLNTSHSRNGKAHGRSGYPISKITHGSDC